MNNNTNNILTTEELAECKRRLGAACGTYAEVFEYAALLGARRLGRKMAREAAHSTASRYWEGPEAIADAVVDRMAPLPVREVPRTSEPDSNGWRWRLRDGKIFTDLGRGDREWRVYSLWPNVDAIIANRIAQGNYADAALLCDLAANPVENSR